MQFWPPDDEHMCSKHLEVWNKLNVKQKFCASSWLITEINLQSVTNCMGYIHIDKLTLQVYGLWESAYNQPVCVWSTGTYIHIQLAYV